jgi:hypothetical protein
MSIRVRRLRACVKKLAVAFTLDRPETLPLIEENLLPVHEALATQSLDEESWDLLKSHLPPRNPGRAWDRCERLRLRAIASAAKNGGTLAGLLRKADALTVQWFVDSCLATRRGGELMRRNVHA